MLVEKVQGDWMDEIPLEAILIWRGEWLRSPADCRGRDRDPMPILHYPGGGTAPPTEASDWVDCATGEYPAAWSDVEGAGKGGVVA